MVKFCTNPVLFKIQYINKEVLNTARGISGVIGQAVHNALAVYYGGVDEYSPTNESEAIEFGLKSGMEFLEQYNDGFIEFTKTVPNKQKAQEIFAYCFNSYVAEKPYKTDKEDIVCIEEKLEESVSVEWKGKNVVLPVPLKGYVDKIVRNKKDKKLRVIDYKSVRSFSNPEKIDGVKMIQAIVYYFLSYAVYGEEPYSMIYEEIKYTKNRDGGPQVKEYEIVFEENELFFDFFFRLYEDITKAINGESVFVPNINALFDNEVSIISYIHRLDVEEETANLLKKLKVDNITELLKQKIQTAGNMRKFLKTAEAKFVSAKNLNYSKMQTEEKIEVKLMEFGMRVAFDSKVEGNTVDLYRFNPSIGLKMSKLEGFVKDMEQVVGVSGIRVLAPIPDSSLVGFEVPKKDRVFPELKVEKDGFNLGIGVDIMGNAHKFDIRRAPHMLIAGATGSGKSVFLNSIISQLNSLDSVELHLFDPKMVELSHFSKEKNVIEYESDYLKIGERLSSLVVEMNNRYKTLQEAGVRSIEDFKGKMPYKFIVIDEFGDISNKAIGNLILKLAQKSRACGIHLIIATQRPSTNIITGDIKANFPTKVAFRTAKSIDSMVLLDKAGAEKLLGKGDMLFISDDGEVRLQGFSC